MEGNSEVILEGIAEVSTGITRYIPKHTVDEIYVRNSGRNPGAVKKITRTVLQDILVGILEENLGKNTFSMKKLLNVF